MDTDPLQALYSSSDTPTAAPQSNWSKVWLLLAVGITAVILIQNWPKPAPRAAEFDDFRIVYGTAWEILDNAVWSSCASEEVWDCDLVLSNLFTTVLVAHYTPEIPRSDATAYEAATRAAWLEANASARFIYLRELTIGGEPAVARVLSGLPNSRSEDGFSGYGMMIFVMDGSQLFEIIVDSASEELFDHDLEQIMALLDRFEFRPRVIEGNTQT